MPTFGLSLKLILSFTDWSHHGFESVESIMFQDEGTFNVETRSHRPKTQRAENPPAKKPLKQGQ